MLCTRITACTVNKDGIPNIGTKVAEEIDGFLDQKKSKELVKKLNLAFDETSIAIKKYRIGQVGGGFRLKI